MVRHPRSPELFRGTITTEARGRNDGSHDGTFSRKRVEYYISFIDLWSESADHRFLRWDGLQVEVQPGEPTAQLSLVYQLERLILDPDPEGATTWIHVMRVNHFFTPDLYLRLLFQTNTGSDRENVQAVFVWRYLPPFGTLQLAFQRGPLRLGSQAGDENALFVKGTAVF